jgi:hypothetical protein
VTDENDRVARQEWFRATLVELHEQFLPLTEGAPAAYTPELATVNGDRFFVDGQVKISIGQRVPAARAR